METAAAPNTALVMSGGGARAAYQVGVLQALAKHFPGLQFPIVTGVSAGAINAVHLATHTESLPRVAEDLGSLWAALRTEKVFRVDARSLLGHMSRWGFQLLGGGGANPARLRGLVDTKPLRAFLEGCLDLDEGRIDGIRRNLEAGRLRSVALTGTSYATGRSVTWVEGDLPRPWDRPFRRSMQTSLRLDHVMASAALPVLFPAVKVGTTWYGDGGIRQVAPLSPALHLGAERILAITTHHLPTPAEAERPVVHGYPPPASAFGLLLNAVFLDAFDHDALMLERINRLVEATPPEQRGALRPVKLMVLRPSIDLGRLAGAQEYTAPRLFRYLMRGMGTRDTDSPDALSMLLFEPAFIERVIACGRQDTEYRIDAIRRFLEGT